jgi:CO dehydrogenase/acetyl-CoA synthase beta subunit
MAEPAQQGLPQDKIVDQPKPEAMQMKQGDGVDAVNALASGDANGFKQAIQNMLNNKVADYLDVKKLDVAQNFLKTKETDSEEQEESEDEVEVLSQEKEKENAEVQ